MNRYLRFALAVIPWLGLIPLESPIARAAGGLIALVAACHGWGVAISYLLGDRLVGWPVRTVWGHAIILAAIALTAAVDGHPEDAMRVVVAAGLVPHAIWFWDPRDPEPRPGIGAMVVWLMYAAFAAINGLAAAASTEAVSLAELAQLDAGLGLAITAMSIVGIAGVRGPDAAAWLLLVGMVVSGLPLPAPAWTIVALGLGAYGTLATRSPDRRRPARRMAPLGLVAGALAAIHVALIPVAIALVGSAVMIEWKPGLRGRPIAIGAIALALPLVPAMAAGLVITGAPHPSAGRALAGLACLTIPLVVGLVVRDRRAGSPLLVVVAALATGLAAIATGLAPGGAATIALILTMALLVAIELARTGPPALGAEPAPPRGRVAVRRAGYLVVVVATCVTVLQLRGARQGNWAERYAELLARVEYLLHRS